MRLWIALVISLVSCMPTNESQVQTNQGGADQLSWFKTPEEIKRTIERYGVNVYGEEELLYFDKLSELYGGKNVDQQQTTLTKPNGIYLLALDALSNWFSCQLLFKELKTKGAVFKGSLLFTEYQENCNTCYADKNSKWCDCDDEITLESHFVKGKIDNTEKLKIMHNIQDIGDFLLIAIDNMLFVEGYDHVPDYLYQKVFIPNLETTLSCALPDRTMPRSDNTDDAKTTNKQSEPHHLEAWRRVIQAILMSGPFYLNVDNREQ